MVATLKGVRVAGIASTVPSEVMTAAQTASQLNLSENETRKLVKMTGIAQRRVASSGLCTSDMAAQSAQELLDSLGWAPDTIDALVFVSQTPDYALPATACILQEQLGLSSHCAAFDVSLGCSGYVYGLWIVASLVASGSVKRALLLAGDTSSQLCSPDDRSTVFLFGDAASATAIEHCADAPPMTFVLGTDGRGKEFLIHRGSGSRNLLPTESSGLSMDGGEVFAFTLDVVPPLINDLLQAAGWTLDDIDFFVPHQANQYILEHLAKSIGIPRQKLTLSLDEFGNTSVASIPLTVTSRLADSLGGGTRQRLVLAGFGVGWSWAGVALQMDSVMVLPPSEVGALSAVLTC
jgi:3-oxoacyl-[acyl-carrier-protein] synthase-3